MELLRQAPAWGFQIQAYRLGGRHKEFDLTVGTDNCDGWLLMSEALSTATVARWRDEGRPVCILARDPELPGLASVRSDNRSGIRLLMETLVGQGHREFAFMGNCEATDIEERRVAFLEYLEETGLPNAPGRTIQASDYSLSGGWQAASTLQASGVGFTALIAGNDQNAAGALQYFRSIGRSVPAELVITGYDNSVLSREPEFSLTTIDQRLDLIVGAALGELARVFQEGAGPPRSLRVKPSMILRSSTHDGQGSLAEPPTSPGVAHEYAAESGRFLYEGEGGAEDYLVRFAQFGRRAVYGEVQPTVVEVTYVSTPEVGTVGASMALRTFGSTLRSPGSPDADLVAQVPFFTAGVVSSVLAVRFPQAQVEDLVGLALAARDLEFLVFSIERSTEHARLEQMVNERTAQIRALQEALVQAARVDVMKPIVVGISHHLGTPLGTTRLALSSLLSQAIRFGLDDDSLELIRVADRSLESSIRLVHRFRNVVEVQLLPQKEVFYPGEEVDLACRRFRLAYPDCRLTCEVLGEGTTWIEGAPLALESAVSEMLDNAGVHGQNPTGETEIHLRVESREGEIVLSVKDNGPGLAHEALTRLFEPFYTTRLADSCGLGLTLVHSVVTTMFQGTVNIETAPGKGFAIGLRLPGTLRKF